MSRKPRDYRNISPAGALLFKGCESVDEKLNKLAECFIDAYTWRTEESRLLTGFDRRLKKLEGEPK